jgi:hypothetical protein
MNTIEQVLDLDGMRAEIADLGEQVAAPDLWDDQENAHPVTGRLSALQGELDRFTELRGSRIDDLEIMVELGQEEGDADTLAEAEAELAPRSRRPSRRSRSAPCSPVSTTPARRWSRSAPAPAASTPPTSPRC